MKLRTVSIVLLLLLAAFAGVREGILMRTSDTSIRHEGGRFFCTLSSAELRERIGQVRAELLEQVVSVDELDGGYRFWLPKSEQNFRVLADFVKAESDCCAFFDFAIALGKGAERVSLEMTGEPEAKRLLERMLVQAGFEG